MIVYDACRLIRERVPDAAQGQRKSIAMCVCERERERERVCVCMCVFVCSLGVAIIISSVQDVMSKIMLKECTIFNDVYSK